MQILIIEDEQPAAKQLAKLIQKIRPQAQLLSALDSIESSVDFLRSGTAPPDLIFMDIQLADGLSFDIFNAVEVQTPVIFTTAFDQYTLRAFKVNSIDYLLKPIDPEELSAALDKYENIYQQAPALSPAILHQLKNALTEPDYKERFLIKVGQQLIYLRTADVRYFFSEESLVYAITNENKKHLVDFSLDQLEQVLSPRDFFRINRKIILHLEAIHRIHTYFNGRLKLDILPRQDLEAIVSRDRVPDFKQWLDR
ncbi:LytR/AlgR family response regulator transcription factor [Flavilitoribacter nigricans]|uniref:DNA-binding response regulator n=1 Tax=Flavilitoribacter nigricans (strain ATCC 23147 / DSM 23189 / NBRC 102662 / NCIMB 1420 / SS-2) TaxID=1122177 RepID=A0A2D0NFG8_FLAN2|nr:LytTR family DNA-binding domain-containing protein [Flavilitoribacter nigricans]PHN07244.1 DNA-binding response regulator [Flavilitoribacter nigricans DSM 23189 = NBRC 102662]